MTAGRPDDGDLLVFPVGHYAGERADGAHRVRVGWSAERLTGEEFAVWMLGHGSADNTAAGWTMHDVAAAADRAAIPDVRYQLDSLRKRGLLATLPGQPTPAAERFAREYLLRALLTGLGDTPENPGTVGVGVPGGDAVVWLDAAAFELWQWGPVAPSLWEVCVTRAAADPGGPMGSLGGLLADLRVLLAHGCAYLDTVARVEGV